MDNDYKCILSKMIKVLDFLNFFFIIYKKVILFCLIQNNFVISK